MKRSKIAIVIWAVVVSVFLCVGQIDISQLRAEYEQLVQENEQTKESLTASCLMYEQMKSEYEQLQTEYEQLEREKRDIETQFNCLYFRTECVYEGLISDYWSEWDIQDDVAESLLEVLEDYEIYLSPDIYGELWLEAKGQR